MVLDAEASSEFGVGVTNGEFLRELSVRDKVLLMCGVLWVNREHCVARPFAGLIDAITVNTTRTADVGAPGAADQGDEDKKPQREPLSHSPTFCVAGLRVR